MNNKKRLIFAVLTILWCYVIFSFSHSTGNSSGNLSLKITQWILSFIWENPQTINPTITDFCHIMIRKGAHMTEYAILYLLSYQFASTFSFSSKKKYVYPMMFSVLYALLDECHQLFVDGRAGKLIDVGIDSCGVLFMMTIIHLVNKRCNRKKTML